MAVEQPNKGLFQHEPLDDGHTSIRLIRIMPVLSPEGLIQCKMFHSTTKAAYRCLSYRWGEFSADLPIMINGARFFVRNQLHAFLQLQRSRMAAISSTSEEPLWVDALCIDQMNIDERGSQVAKMSQIFSSASEVLIWLGSTPMLSSFGAGYIKRSDIEKTVLSQLSDEQGEISPLLGYTWLARKKDPARIYGGLERGDGEFYSKQQIIEEEIIDNKYWRRAWITQEVCLAREAFLVLEGEKNLPLRRLIEVVNLAEWPTTEQPFWQLSRLLSNWWRQSVDGRKYLSLTFMPLLFWLRDTDCAIPRDRIFSILPLYRWGHLMKVDYNIPDDRLLVDVLSNVREPVSLCFVASFIYNLRPLSGPLGTGYVEIDLPLTTLSWGHLQIFRTHSPKPSEPRGKTAPTPPIYARSLDRASDVSDSSPHGVSLPKPQLSSTGSDCKFWLSMRQHCLRQITLVGLPGNCSWDDASIPGERIMLPTEIQHEAKDHPKALPGPASSKQWRLYTAGVTLREQPGSLNVWTFRISLATMWAYIEEIEWKRPQLCNHLCGDIRLGYEDD